MTVQTSTTRADYTGNGATTIFPVPFYFLDNTHIKVLRTDTSTTPPTTATLVLNSDYTVSGAGVVGGGAITTTVAPTAGQKLAILRNVPFTQLVHYVPNDPFPAATHEQALDQLTMAVQQLNEVAGHAIVFPTYEPLPATLLPAAQRAATMLGFDSNGNLTYLPLPASVGAGDLRNESWTAGTDYTLNSSTTVTLSRAYGSKANLGTVVMDGVAQDPATYSLINNGTQLQFNAAVPAGRVWCVGGTTLSVFAPATKSVGDLQIADGRLLPWSDTTATYHMVNSGTGTIPVFQTDFTESLSPGSGVFVDGVVVNHTRTNGNGHRQAFTAQISSSGANTGEFLVGSCGFGFLQSGSGNVSGMNAYAQVLATAAATAEMVGLEANTDARRPVVRKTGVQIVDVSTSTADASTISAALYIVKQAGGAGWQNGIQFGDDSNPTGMAPTAVDLIRLAGSTGSVPLVRGVDFRAGNFSGPAIDLPPNSALAFGGGASGSIGVGGTLQSVTNAAGPVIQYGNQAVAVLDNALTAQALSVLTSPGSQSVSVYMPGVGLRQLQVGAPNSGGPGVRAVVCPN